MEMLVPGAAPAETQRQPQDFESALKEAQNGFYGLTFEPGNDAPAILTIAS